VIPLLDKSSHLRGKRSSRIVSGDLIVGDGAESISKALASIFRLNISSIMSGMTGGKAGVHFFT